MSQPKNWLTNLKHEITTPINGIIGYSELLLEEITSDLDANFLQSLEDIKSLGYELLALIKQDLGSHNLNENQPEEQILNILKNFSYKISIPLIKASEICERLLLNPPPDSQSDLQKIKQSIQKLLSLLEEVVQSNFPQVNVNKSLTSVEFNSDNEEEKNLNIHHQASHILIVDDNENNQELLARHLTNAGYKISIANNGFQGIEMISSGQYDLILLDMLMPDISGYEVLQWIKHSQWQNLPVIMVSSIDELDSVVNCIEKGAEDYIHKPFNPILLKTKVSAFLEKKYLRDKEIIYLTQLAQTNQELRQKNELIRQIFGRYLSNEVVNELLESPTGLKLGGERRNLTILTSDVRGFTAIAESLEPEKVVRILNIYFLHITNIIEKYHGTIDKFMGDGVLVLFGIPTAKEDDTLRAIACAIEMQLSMVTINQELTELDLPTIEIGIAINTGEVIVGNIGSEKRTDYSVVGNQVNLAYRIESYTIGGQVLISESTWEKSKSFVKIADSQLIYPKGIQKPLTIYNILGIKGEYNLDLPQEKEPLKPLNSEILLNYTLLEGKQINLHIFQGQLIELSPKKALILSHQRRLDDLPSHLNNIKINLLNSISGELSEDIYAKVLAVDIETRQFLAHFTFKPIKAKALLQQIYNSVS